jgi:hypothetical protein
MQFVSYGFNELKVNYSTHVRMFDNWRNMKKTINLF